MLQTVQTGRVNEYQTWDWRLAYQLLDFAASTALLLWVAHFGNFSNSGCTRGFRRAFGIDRMNTAMRRSNIDGLSGRCEDSWVWSALIELLIIEPDTQRIDLKFQISKYENNLVHWHLKSWPMFIWIFEVANGLNGYQTSSVWVCSATVRSLRSCHQSPSFSRLFPLQRSSQTGTSKQLQIVVVHFYTQRDSDENLSFQVNL